MHGLTSRLLVFSVFLFYRDVFTFFLLKFRLLAWVLVFGEKKEEIIPQLDGALLS